MASGNVLVSGGMLFSTNGRRVEARFEWHAMVARARAAAETDDATLGDARTLGRLLLERAESLIASGRAVERGIELAEESLDWLERFGGRTRAGEPVTAESRELAGDVHRALMAASRGHRTIGAGEGEALARRALALADAPEARLEALLVLQEEVSSQVAAGTARAALLAEILGAHGQEPVIVSARSTSEWSAAGAFREVLAARGEGAPERGGDPWRDPWRLEPVPLLAAPGGVAAERVDHTEAEMPAGLFVRIAQAMDARRGPDLEERLSTELDALHAVLAEHPEVLIFDTTSGLWAASRIQSIRVLWPSSDAVARIEARARETFDAAMDVARATGSTEDLELLPVLFPGSAAARQAADARMEFALENGTPAEVAAIVSEALPRDWHPASSSTEDTRMLLGPPRPSAGWATALSARGWLRASPPSPRPAAAARRPPGERSPDALRAGRRGRASAGALPEPDRPWLRRDRAGDESLQGQLRGRGLRRTRGRHGGRPHGQPARAARGPLRPRGPPPLAAQRAPEQHEERAGRSGRRRRLARHRRGHAPRDLPLPGERRAALDLPSAPARRGFDRGGQRGVPGHGDPRPGTRARGDPRAGRRRGRGALAARLDRRVLPPGPEGRGRAPRPLPSQDRDAAVHDLFTGFPIAATRRPPTSRQARPA